MAIIPHFVLAILRCAQDDKPEVGVHSNGWFLASILCVTNPSQSQIETFHEHKFGTFTSAKAQKRVDKRDGDML